MLQDNSNDQTTSFGVNFWYTVPSDIAIDGDTVQRVAEHFGFSGDKEFKLPSRKLEVSRAARSFQDRRHKNDRRITELTKETGNSISYGILNLNRQGDEEVSFDQSTTVRLNKDSGHVTVEGNLSTEFHEALERFTGAITDDDIRKFLLNLVGRNFGVAKRPTGGIYFVPGKYADNIKKAQSFLDALGTEAVLYVERVVDGKPERENVWGSVESEVKNRIEDTLNAVSRIEKRSSSIVTQQGKLSELKELVEVYQDLLGEEAKYEGIFEQLREAEVVVQSKLSELQNQVALNPTNGNGSNLLGAVAKVLEDQGGPLDFREITQAAIDRGYYSTTASKPSESVNSAISKAISKGDSRFKRVGKGTYELAGQE